MRRVFPIVIVLVVAVLAVGDYALRRVAEGRVEKAAQSSLNLDERPEVSVAGWPFTLNLVRGSFPSITVSLDDIKEGDVVVAEAQVVFSDVSFSLGRLLSGDRRKVEVDSASGSAVITESDVTNAIQARGNDIVVDFSPSGATLTSETFGGEINADIALSDGALVVEAAGVEPISLELPQLARGVAYRSLSLSDSEASVELIVGRTTLRF